jgi:hypothetical protein
MNHVIFFFVVVMVPYSKLITAFLKAQETNIGQPAKAESEAGKHAHVYKREKKEN